jgi:menaquinone-specific isochorismate synthase
MEEASLVINCQQAHAVTLEEGRTILKDKLQSILDTFHANESSMIYKYLRLQVAVTLEDVDDTILWLRGQKVLPRIFYADPEQRLVSAGAGSAHTLQGTGYLETFPIHSNLPPEFRYYGGERFDQASSPEKEWSDFGGHLFVLPRMELVRSREPFSDKNIKNCSQVLDSTEQEFLLAVNIFFGDGAKVHRHGFQEQLQDALQCVQRMGTSWLRKQCPIPMPSATELDTSWEQWRAAVDGALERMASGQLDKVVLARSCLVRLAAAVDPLDILLRLRPAGSYRFFLQPAHGRAFLGCSPERLFRAADGVIETVAMAGTCPRGGSESEDAALAAQLLGSAKDSCENSVTADYIRRRLASVAADVIVGDVFVTKLRHVQHLCRTIRATLRPAAPGARVPAGELLRCLSPTPAVCGEPRPAAAAWIRRVEPRDRGLYSGPVGVVSGRSAEFLVAIRSALTEPDAAGGGGCRALRVYGGAGIVPGSEALGEWRETALKMRAVLQALPRDPPPPPSPTLAPAACRAPEPPRCGPVAGGAGCGEVARAVVWARERVEGLGLSWLVELVACCCLGETLFRAVPGLFLLF